MNSEYVSIVGNVTWIGDIHKTKQDKSVVNIGIVVSFDKRNEDGSWTQNGGGMYYENVTVYGKMADNSVASLKPGDQVIVVGRRVPKQDYVDNNGVEHKNENQINADAIGPTLQMVPWNRPRKEGGAKQSAPAATQQATAPAPATQQAPAPAPQAQPAPAPVTTSDDEDFDW